MNRAKRRKEAGGTLSPPSGQLQKQHTRETTARKAQRKAPGQLRTGSSLSSSQPELPTTAVVVVEAGAVDATGLPDGPVAGINKGGGGPDSPRDSPRTRQKLERAKDLDKEVVASRGGGGG